jgi:hypothetical protein
MAVPSCRPRGRCDVREPDEADRDQKSSRPEPIRPLGNTDPGLIGVRYPTYSTNPDRVEAGGLGRLRRFTAAGAVQVAAEARVCVELHRRPPVRSSVVGSPMSERRLNASASIAASRESHDHNRGTDTVAGPGSSAGNGQGYPPALPGQSSCCGISGTHARLSQHALGSSGKRRPGANSEERTAPRQAHRTYGDAPTLVTEKTGPAADRRVIKAARSWRTRAALPSERPLPLWLGPCIEHRGLAGEAARYSDLYYRRGQMKQRREDRLNR